MGIDGKCHLQSVACARLRGLSVSSLLFAAVLSCARNPNPGQESESGLRNAEVTLEVHNHHWLDIDVYLVMVGSHEERVGTVPGSSTHVFSLPWRRVARGMIRLKADPIGTRSVLYTENISVQPYSVIEWTIEDGLTRSVVSVF